jgi:hypothetical protein
MIPSAAGPWTTGTRAEHNGAMVDTSGTTVLRRDSVRSLVLPHLVAGRDLADSMIDRLGDLEGSVVVVDARGTATGSASFASQLVLRVLRDGRADSMVVVGAPPRLAEQVTQSAKVLDVATRMDLSSSMPTIEPAPTP